MSYGPTYSSNAFVPTTQVFPEDASQLLIVLTNMYTTLAQSLNQRQLGDFTLDETVTGQNYYNPTDVQIPRQGFRKAFEIPAIPAGGTYSTSHGISGATLFTHFYGGVITSVVDYRPVPYVDTTIITNQISITVTATNLIIVNGATAPNITSGYVILEYCKN